MDCRILLALPVPAFSFISRTQLAAFGHPKHRLQSELEFNTSLMQCRTIASQTTASAVRAVVCINRLQAAFKHSRTTSILSKEALSLETSMTIAKPTLFG